ncbi:CFEM domain-containing protein [Xylariales sp. AK1849]|nr:CFEM domain-containing protein [Xylariales sp. AK1849]
MRFFVFIASLLLAVLPAVAATASASAPTCGLLCISLTTLASDCSITDTACICTNAALNAEIEACVASNCTVKEALETQKYSYDACGQEGEDRTALVWITGVTFGALGLLTFALRCTARLHLGAQSWGLDDWAMCLVMCFMIPLCVLSVPLSQHGLGLDMWNVDFDDITSILYLYFFDEMLYIAALAFTKVSILLFYLKVFPKRSFRICAYVLIALNICYAVGYVLVLIFQCSPIDGAWLSWDGEYSSQCISINVLGWSAAAINIALDLATIILPLPELFQLSMSWKRKVQILLMFAVGFFVTLVSVIRLRSLIEFGTTTNVTQDYVEVGYWSTIEVPVGVICACMPAVRSLFSTVFPSMFGSTRRDKYDYGSQGLSSRTSAMPKLSSTANSTQIRIKQEWTVMSNPVDNRSDVELVSFEQQAAAEAPMRKLTLTNQHGQWNGREHPTQGSRTMRSDSSGSV